VLNKGAVSMSKLLEMLKISHTPMVFVTGLSVLAIACSSRWVLPEPINPFLLTIPPIIDAIYESLAKKYKEAKFLNPWYWVCAIILTTALLIIFHMV
jgi:hypothetical protein